MVMKGWTIAVCLIFLAGLAIPVPAAPIDKFGYITIHDVEITLEGAQANINVNYTLDEPTQVIVLLLGKQDLKTRLLTVLNYEDADVKTVELNHAKLVVDDASYAYGRGVYWFPEHSFNGIIPKLRIITPQVSREYAEADSVPNGIGYFAD
jgi:hypothetical protein